MNPRLLIAASLIGVLGIAAAFGLNRGPKDEQPAAAKPIDPVARGKYLVTLAACTDCHSPHNEKGEVIAGREFSGHPENAPLPQWDPSMMGKNAVATISPTLTAFAGPWGVSVAPNLTPDMETGMGVLSAEGLIDSWKTSRHWKGLRPVLPPMPIDAYKSLTDEDIRAIHAYLRSLPAVKNRAPDSVINMPPASSIPGSTPSK